MQHNDLSDPEPLLEEELGDPPLPLTTILDQRRLTGRPRGMARTLDLSQKRFWFILISTTLARGGSEVERDLVLCNVV